jgi:hypothetical protein
MTVDEAGDRLERLEQMIKRDLPVFIQQRVAHSAAEMIENRVRTTGRNYQGRPFKPYSRKPTLSSGVTAKSGAVGRALAGSKTKRRQLQWRTVKHKGKNVRLFVVPGGYAQVRKIEGLQTRHKDFWFTTMMWRGFGTKHVQKTPGKVTITLGGKTQESQDKINRNSDREGVNIVNISNQELDLLAKMIDKEIQRYVNRLGLS